MRTTPLVAGMAASMLALKSGAAVIIKPAAELDFMEAIATPTGTADATATATDQAPVEPSTSAQYNTAVAQNAPFYFQAVKELLATKNDLRLCRQVQGLPDLENGPVPWPLNFNFNPTWTPDEQYGKLSGWLYELGKEYGAAQKETAACLKEITAGDKTPLVPGEMQTVVTLPIHDKTSATAAPSIDKTATISPIPATVTKHDIDARDTRVVTIYSAYIGYDIMRKALKHWQISLNLCNTDNEGSSDTLDEKYPEIPQFNGTSESTVNGALRQMQLDISRELEEVIEEFDACNHNKRE